MFHYHRKYNIRSRNKMQICYEDEKSVNNRKINLEDQKNVKAVYKLHSIIWRRSSQIYGENYQKMWLQTLRIPVGQKIINNRVFELASTKRFILKIINKRKIRYFGLVQKGRKHKLLKLIIQDENRVIER